MRIAINTRFLLPNHLEGIGWFSYETAKRMVLAHPEHEFIFLFDRPFDERFIFADNVKGVSVFPPARHPFLFYLWFEWAIPAALKKHRADVFLSPDGFASLRSKVPTLMVMHDIAYKHYPEQIGGLVRRYYEYYVPRFLNRAERIATVSEYSKQDMIRHFDLPPEKIDVVYDGSNEAFQPLSPEEKQTAQAQYSQGKPYFLYLGSVHPRKNLPRLLQAFERFKQNNKSPIQLLCAGRMAWQTGDTQAVYESMQHSDAVHWLDYVPTEELPHLLGGALALTYVSLFEGFGIPILEAMQCDVPVLTSTSSSMPEVAGNAGLLVDPTDVGAIAQGMQRLYQEPALRQEMIEKGRTQRQQFSWDKTARLLWESLERVYNKKGTH